MRHITRLAKGFSKSSINDGRDTRQIATIAAKTTTQRVLPLLLTSLYGGLAGALIGFAINHQDGVKILTDSFGNICIYSLTAVQHLLNS